MLTLMNRTLFSIRRNWQLAMTLAMAMALLAPASVWAAPPQPGLSRTPSPLMGFGLMFLLAIVVVAISIMPSKRSHQD